MKVPTTQKELVQLLQEQEQHIELMRKAIIRLEQKLKGAVVLIERTAGNNRMLKQRVDVLKDQFQELKSG